MNSELNRQDMNNPTPQELELIEIIRKLKPYEDISIKKDDQGKVIFTYTQRQRIVVLTHTLNR